MYIHKNNSSRKISTRIDDPLLAKARDKSLIFEILDLIEDVRKDKGKAILRYYLEKKIDRKNIFVSQEEVRAAVKRVGKENLSVMHNFTLRSTEVGNTQKKFVIDEEIIQKTGGFNALLSYRPLNCVGIYIPRNLPSSLIYYCELAKRAGVKDILLALPPEKDGFVNPVLLAAANTVGVDKILAVGGLRAFATLAFGVGFDLVPDKIFGPSSFYVDLVKQILNTFYKIPIDLSSGPTEIAVFIDYLDGVDQAVADLFAQLEHGSDSRFLVLTTNKQIYEQLNQKLAILSYENSEIVLAAGIQESFDAINTFSPEILEVFSEKKDLILPYIKNASNVYFNTSSPLGDYLVAGKGCADPTFGMSKGNSGITIRSFLKTMCITTTNEGDLDKDQVETAKNIAHMEGFNNHKKAIEKYELWKNQ